MTENPKHNPRAIDRYDRAGFKRRQYQVVNKIPTEWDFAVVRTDLGGWLYKDEDSHPRWDDARVVTKAEGFRTVAAGRKAILDREYEDREFEVRAYRKE